MAYRDWVDYLSYLLKNENARRELPPEHITNQGINREMVSTSIENIILKKPSDWSQKVYGPEKDKDEDKDASRSNKKKAVAKEPRAKKGPKKGSDPTGYS